MHLSGESGRGCRIIKFDYNIGSLHAGRVVFTLSGRIEAEDVKGLQELLALETAGRQLVLDLRDVTLVNQDAVEFLAGCEADSIKLENCPAYIREWIERVKGRTRRRRTR
jgi:anti-anti-sigma regulatory factor